MKKITYFAYAAVVVLLASPAVFAQGKGGGKGGGGENLTGTVYFTFQGLTWTMDPDGTGKIPLPAGVGGEPSYALHGDLGRWFLTVESGELFAISQDGLVESPLTDPLDAVTVSGLPRWAKDDPGTATVDEADTFVGYIGTDTSGNQALYRLAITWLLDVPFEGAVPVEVLSESDIPVGTDLAAFDWSPDGDSLLYQVNTEGLDNREGNQFLRIKDLVFGLSYALADGRQAEWSPDGAKIVFRDSAALGPILTINPDGSDPKIILKGHGGFAIVVDLPKWAPTSAHLVYDRHPYTVYDSKEDPHIYRATASGGSKTKLTGDLETDTFNLVNPVAWR